MPIPGVRYDGEGVAVADVAYTYADAVRDGICRPVTFIPYDGDAAVALGRRRHRGRVRHRPDHARGRPPLPDRDQRRADRRPAADPRRRPRQARRGPRRRAPRRRRPRRRRRLRARAQDRQAAQGRQRQEPDRRPAHRGAARTRSSRRSPTRASEWLVAVNMVSEGVDIPRLRVGVYATRRQDAADLPPGRRPLRPDDRGAPGRDVVALPARATRSCARHATDVEGELRHVLRRRESDEELFDERPERAREREAARRRSSSRCRPTSRPQMSLFGGARRRRVADPAVVRGRRSRRRSTSADEAARLSAFERRDILRDKRHRLVGDLAPPRPPSAR